MTEHDLTLTRDGSTTIITVTDLDDDGMADDVVETLRRMYGDDLNTDTTGQG